MLRGVEFINREFALTKFSADGEGVFDSGVVVESDVNLHLRDDDDKLRVSLEMR